MRKRKFGVMGVLICILLVSATIRTRAESSSELEERKNRVTSEKNDLKWTLANAIAEKNDLLAEITRMDIAIEELTQELEAVEVSLAETSAELEQAELDLEEATQSKANQMDALIKRLRVMDENGSMIYLQILFSSTSIADFLNRYENVQSVADYDSKMFENLAATEKLIEEKVGEISDKKAETERLLENRTASLLALEENVEYKNKRVETLAMNADNDAARIADLERAERDISALILKAQADEAHNRRVADELRRQAAAQSAMNQTYSGGMIWPLPGYSRISSGYQQRVSPITGKWEFHSGIDIPAPKGTLIKSAAKGIVIYSGTINGYGYTVIVDHGGGVSTQYSHCSSLLVSVGDSVEQGASIAKVGSTGWSTGNHLHFEVHLNGAHTNPTAYVRP